MQSNQPAGELAVGASDSDSVCVAVHLRPLIASELEQGSRSCLNVTPGCPQIGTGQHNFTYDHVFGGDFGGPPAQLYYKCVAPLVEGLFKGYNATVFAYGQTGSGKTYTMGSEYRPGGRRTSGVIPEAINAIFNKIAQAKDWQCSVRVSFVEIHKEEVRDLLVTQSGPRAAVSIREVMGGGVCLCGAVEKEVRSQDEMAALLETGTLCRATASTNMNNRSSRSHAIFTITVEQRRQESASGGQAGGAPIAGQGRDDDDDEDNDNGGGEADGGMEDSYLCAKMHLVDLAGSERAKRTKAEGARLKEGIHINRGLLALGNVINAIVDAHKHVPYRDSKLTRLLQDSLGGNSRTVMIACVSPADINFEESLNTLRYADRARHIRNKPTVNRDPVAAQVAFFRQQIAALRSENIALKAALGSEGKALPSLGDEDGAGSGGGAGHWAVVDTLQQENTSLELENTRLKMQLEEVTRELEGVKERSYLMQASLDRVTAEVQLLSGGESTSASGAANAHDVVVAGYVGRIAELEKELRVARQFHNLRRRHTQHATRPGTGAGAASGDEGGGNPPATPLVGMLASTPVSLGGGLGFSPELGGAGDGEEGGGSMGALAEGQEEEGDTVAEEEMYYAEMAAHALEQEKMKHELVALTRLLDSKEKRMAELQSGSGQVPALKQHYDRVLAELQRERDSLMSEKVAIMQKLQHLQSANEEERRRLEATYKDKLAAADEKLRNLRHKEREFISMQKLKQRTEDMCKRLSNDITRIKQQKVAIQKMMETSSKQFAQWRYDREKELTQLRKQARRSAAQIQALEAMQAKQNAVLQRKIADANAARKKLRELQGSNGADRNGGGVRDSHSRLALNAADARTGGADGPLEVQPNAGAPLLRTERARREWLEKELDLCNQSYEYRRVLEGELAQRAEANRQLRNVMKRLMLVNNLVPASPLVAGPNGCPTPCGPNQVGDVVVSQLIDRRQQLERQLQEHNMQISELQAAWERAKSDEEGRGGGAADAKRWTLVRNVVECRELLKTTFRLACDHKAASADSALEGLKLMEELDLLRVQLDAARKEADAQRKRAAAIEATAASAIATPYTSSLAASAAAQRADETDREVEDLLQQLHMAKTPSGLRPTEDESSVQLSAVEDEGPQLGSPDGSVEVSVELPSRSGHESHGLGRSGSGSEGTVLGRGSGKGGLLASVGAAGGRGAEGRGGRRAGSVPHDAELQGRYPGASNAWDAHQLSSGAEDEDQESSDDDDDEEWDPANPTPHRSYGRTARRRSGAAAAGTATGVGRSFRLDGTGGAAGAVGARRASRGTSGGGGATGDVGTGVAGLRTSGAGALSGRWADGRQMTPLELGVQAFMHYKEEAESERFKQLQPGYLPGPFSKETEAQVLAHINQARAAVGQPPEKKLTVPVLKDALKGTTAANGGPWQAGKKARDFLVSDYLVHMSLITDSTTNHHDPTTNGSLPPTFPSSQGPAWPSLPMPAPVLPFPGPLRSSSVFSSARGKSASHDGCPSPRAGIGRGSGDVVGVMLNGRGVGAYSGDGGFGPLVMPELSPVVCPQGGMPGSPGASRDYRAAVLSPSSSQLRTQFSQDASPRSGHNTTRLSQLMMEGVTSTRGTGGQGPQVPGLPLSYLGNPLFGHTSHSSGLSPKAPVRASYAALGGSMVPGPQVSASPRISSGGTPTATGNMTPMSLLYVQKAQEARKRMNDIRSTMPRQLGNSTPGRLGNGGGGGSPVPSPHGPGAFGAPTGAVAAMVAARNAADRRSPQGPDRRSPTGMGRSPRVGLVAEQGLSPGTSAGSTPRAQDRRGEDRRGEAVRASGSPLTTNSGRARGGVWK